MQVWGRLFLRAAVHAGGVAQACQVAPNTVLCCAWLMLEGVGFVGSSLGKDDGAGSLPVPLAAASLWRPLREQTGD